MCGRFGVKLLSYKFLPFSQFNQKSKQKQLPFIWHILMQGLMLRCFTYVMSLSLCRGKESTGEKNEVSEADRLIRKEIL